MSRIPYRANFRSNVATSKGIRLLTLFFVPLFLLILPWFYGLTGLRDQLITQVTVYSFSLFIYVLTLIPSKKCEPSAMSGIDIAFIGAVCFILFHVTLSVLPFYSLMTAVRFGAVAIFFILIRSAYRTDGVQRGLLAAILAAGIIYGIYGILQLKGVFPKDYWYEATSLASRYVNSGHFAGFLIMPFFSALILFALARSVLMRLLFLSTVAFLSIVIVLTKSRTVWVSLTAGLLFFMGMLNALKPFSRKYYLFLTAGAAMLGTAAYFGGMWHSITIRFLELQSMNFFSIYHRFHFWQGAFSAIISRPWGWGLGTFVHIFPHFRVHSDRFIVDYAHNEILQIGVDLGVLGICGFIFLLGAYLQFLWRVMRTEKGEYHAKVKIAGLGAGILTLAIASQFDFPLRIYANAFFAAAFLGVQASLMEDESRRGQDSALSMRIYRVFSYKRKFVFAIFALAGLMLSGFNLHAEMNYQLGRRLEKDFDWDSAMRRYQKAISFAPWASEYEEAGGRLAEKRSVLTMSAEARKQWLRTALDFYVSASRKNKYWPSSFYKAGILNEKLGDKRQAGLYLREAYLREPTNPLYIFDYGMKQLEMGHYEEGIDLLEDFVKEGYYDPVSLTQTQILEKVFPYVKDSKQLRRIVFNRAYALHDFGVFLIQKGQLKEGASVLHIASEWIRNENGYQFYLEHFGLQDGQVYSRAGLYNEAAAIYDEAVKQGANPASYQVYLDAALKGLKEL